MISNNDDDPDNDMRCNDMMYNDDDPDNDMRYRVVANEGTNLR